jgi:hypothetical protein
MRAFVYCRVSTKEQGSEAHYSLENQEERATASTTVATDAAARVAGCFPRRCSGTLTCVLQKRHSTEGWCVIWSCTDAPHEGHFTASPAFIGGVPFRRPSSCRAARLPERGRRYRARGRAGREVEGTPAEGLPHRDSPEA